jgi:hypothetical protein
VSSEAWERLGEYLGLADIDQHRPDLQADLATATELVTHYIGGAEVPGPVVSNAITEVGAKLYRRRVGTTDGLGAAGDTPAPLPARDPLVSV